MANQESTTRTLLVALVVCLVSSVFVAGAAVALKPTQAENRLLDKQRSILAIAGLGEPGMSGKEVRRCSTVASPPRWSTCRAAPSAMPRTRSATTR